MGWLGHRLLRPLVLQLAPTNACNLHCRHCYRTEPGRLPDEWGLLGQAGLVAAWVAFASLLGRPPVVVLTGGEPLLARDLADLVHAAVRAGAGVRLNTNAILATPERIERLVARGLSFAQVSLEAPDAEGHESVRGSGTFARTARGVATMRRAGIEVWLKVTVGAGPLASPADWLALARAWEVCGIAFSRVLPLGRWPAGQTTVLPDAVWHAQCEALDDPEGIRLVWRDAPFARSQASIEGAPWRSEEGRDILAVDADGSWLVSRRMPVVLGKAGRMGPREAWGHPLMRALRAWRPEESCGGCPHTERCQGGSRAMAMARLGDWGLRDPDCSLPDFAQAG